MGLTVYSLLWVMPPKPETLNPIPLKGALETSYSLLWVMQDLYHQQQHAFFGSSKDCEVL